MKNLEKVQWFGIDYKSLLKLGFGALLIVGSGCQNTGGGGSGVDKFFGPLPGNNSGTTPPNAVTPQPSFLNFGGSGAGDKDPLLGGGVPISRLPVQNGQNTAIAGNMPPPNTNGVPNLPAPYSSTSPAALATGNFSTLDPTRTNVTPVNATAIAGIGTAANSQFGSPEEFRSLMQQLSSRGMTWQRLDHSIETGDWKFYCAIKDPTQAGATRNYETAAKTDVAALKAVLAEINKTMPIK